MRQEEVEGAGELPRERVARSETGRNRERGGAGAKRARQPGEEVLVNGQRLARLPRPYSI